MESRVFTRPALVEVRRQWRLQGLTVVFTNGCYDLLHPGHVRLLERARALGDRLIVAINSDASVQRLKGPERPILPEPERAELIAALEAVDAVTVFDENTLHEAVLLDVLVNDGLTGATGSPTEKSWRRTEGEWMLDNTSWKRGDSPI